MRVGLSTTAIFGDLSGYFFRNFKDKASNIIWRYATPCRPDLQNKLRRMTLSGYFMYNSIFAIVVLDSEGSTIKHNCVRSNEHIAILSAARI